MGISHRYPYIVLMPQFVLSPIVYRHTATLTKFLFHLFLLDYKFMLQDKCK